MSVSDTAETWAQRALNTYINILCWRLSEQSSVTERNCCSIVVNPGGDCCVLSVTECHWMSLDPDISFSDSQNWVLRTVSHCLWCWQQAGPDCAGTESSSSTWLLYTPGPVIMNNTKVQQYHHHYHHHQHMWMTWLTYSNVCVMWSCGPVVLHNLPGIHHCFSAGQGRRNFFWPKTKTWKCCVKTIERRE